MRGLYFHGTPTLRRDLPTPAPQPGEALIQVLTAGICRTDVEILKGYLPFQGILGHEFVGKVTAAPENPQWLGQRVVGEINIACGTCPECRKGMAIHCPQRQALGIRGHHGCFADFLALPVANLHRVATTIPDRHAVFTEPLAAALAIVERFHIRPSHRLGVVGDGKLGLLIAQVLALTGSQVTVMGHHPERLGLLRHPAITFLDPQTATAAGWDVTVECSGAPAGLALAVHHTRSRGLVVQKSSFQAPPVWPGNEIMVREITIAGSRCGPFPPALALLERDILVLDPLIHAIRPLDDAVAALEQAQQRGTMKLLLTHAPPYF